MSVQQNPRDLSQRELEDLLDRMTLQGKDDTPEFERAYAEWERRDA